MSTQLVNALNIHESNSTQIKASENCYKRARLTDVFHVNGQFKVMRDHHRFGCPPSINGSQGVLLWLPMEPNAACSALCTRRRSTCLGQVRLYMRRERAAICAPRWRLSNWAKINSSPNDSGLINSAATASIVCVCARR
jgi:hypothetical protein